MKTQLNFVKLKQAIKCPPSDDILTFINSLPDAEAKLATQVVLDHEIDDAKTSAWMPGAANFVNHALSETLPLAIVTRNCLEATQLKISNNQIPINLIVTREDAPPKPDPTALIMIAKKWNLPYESIAYIGDYKYDIEAAHNANMQAWLFEESDDNADFKDCLTLVPKAI